MNPDFALDASQIAGNPTVTVKAVDQVGNEDIFAVDETAINVIANPVPDIVDTACGADPEVTDEEDLEDIYVDADPDTVASLAEDQLGSEYRGFYVDRSSCPAVIAVLAADPESAAAEAFALDLDSEGVDPELVDMRAAAFSESDLDDAADAASDEIQAGSYDGGYVIEPDIEGQQLIVTANSTFSLGQQSAVEGVVAARPSPVDDIPVEFEEAEPVWNLITIPVLITHR